MLGGDAHDLSTPASKPTDNVTHAPLAHRWSSGGSDRNGKPARLESHRPHLPMATEIALAALSNLPTPLLVLSSQKTVLLANAAVGRLLGIDSEDGNTTITDLLEGQTLSQIGIDMVSDGVPIWVSWEKFLDNLTHGLLPSSANKVSTGELLSGISTAEAAPTSTLEARRGRSRSPLRTRTQKSQDTVVDVVISNHPGHLHPRTTPTPSNPARTTGVHATCRMIISIWTLGGDRFYTLTFTSLPGKPPTKSRMYSQTSSTQSSTRDPSSHSAESARSSPLQTPNSSTANSQIGSPAEQMLGTTFTPTSAPPQCVPSIAMTDFQKVIKMKNAMLNAIEMPLVAMWKDESVVFPNLAARKLLAVDADPTSDESYDFLSRFTPWASDFSRKLDEEANPVVALCRSQKAFTNWKIGLMDETTGTKFNFDVSGHPVLDEKSGEFLAGLIAFKDVTEYTTKIADQFAENEAQFRLICDMMPQMLWTTRADGYHDYFSQRWYDYTGLTPANSLGLGWRLPFHEDDMPEANRRWQHSLATGEEYKTQYRCRKFDGEWRWMLGHALPMRDHKTGKILKWFGSCTDVQDLITAKVAGQRARQNLLDVLKHSQMTLWIINRNKQVTFFEGAFATEEENSADKFMGRSIFDVLGKSLAHGAVQEFTDGLNRTLAGASDFEICENKVGSRWFRSKMIPLKGKGGPNGAEDSSHIAGVIIIGTDVTSLREKEQENIKLLANETAAKEASKMKSNFLANMSHEIRTPIAGVLGMSELLMDTKLDGEQSDFAQNIQRSANSLLSVINDILDFSKIESGRLDIEEVQFSLGVLLQDVTKMLSFAVARKGLKFISDIRLGPSENLIMLGDPGRIRQILTNLLTNSIKFTSEGYVKLSSRILSETSDTTKIEFCVEDSGIGIEEEVRRRLFKPFSQADSSTARRFGGTGLGLTICKNLVDLMHGTIQLDSKLDAGTKATFCIPFKRVEYENETSSQLLEVGMMPDRLQSDLSVSLTTSSEEKARKSQRLTSPLKSTNMSLSIAPTDPQPTDTIPEPSRKNIHILVVEDNPVNQQIALKFISALKFSAKAVWNGKEAIEYLLKATSSDLTPEEAIEYPIPALILMDVQMPVLDGYHATHLLRHHAPFTKIEAIPRIPIIAMTASAIQGDREKCERAGMDDYMAKPVKRSLLQSTILKWISSGRRVDQVDKVTSDRPLESEKPRLGRACTDRSSSCTEYDAIASEFYARRTQVDDESADAEQVLMPQNGANIEPTVRGFARRSSISRTILDTEIPGGETEGDRAIRRAEAEDKAQALRDAKLLSATERAHDHSHGQSTLTPSVVVDDTHMPDSQAVSPGSTPGDADDAADKESRMALTEANMSLFNTTQEGQYGSPRLTSPSLGDVNSDFPVPDIPGPPPEETLTTVDLSNVPISNAETVASSSILEAEPLSQDTAQPLATFNELPHLARDSRRAVGGLSLADRHNSDWSSSTARPEASC